MNEPRYPRLLAKALARRSSGEPAPLPLARSADEIELIQRTMQRKSTRRRVRAVAGVCGALMVAAAGVALHRAWRPPVEARLPSVAAVAFVASSSGQGTMIVSGGSSVLLDTETPLAAGSRLLVGPVAGASLALSTGSHLAIEPGSDVALVGRGRAAIFKLGAGSLRADVAKLAPSDQFVVRTADSEVEVRGTSFRVSVVLPDPDCGDGTTTHVQVYEGTVVVRSRGHEETIEKGEEWPRGCGEALAPRPSITATETSSEARSGARAPSRSISSRNDVSNLGVQNDQFADAMIAKRRGDVPAALAAFDRFLTTYPTSHLAENAAAERMKLLATIDRAKARAAARQYLQKYPAGFSRDDARAILAAP